MNREEKIKLLEELDPTITVKSTHTVDDIDRFLELARMRHAKSGDDKPKPELSENVRNTHRLKSGLYPTRIVKKGMAEVDLRNIPDDRIQELVDRGILIPNEQEGS